MSPTNSTNKNQTPYLYNIMQLPKIAYNYDLDMFLTSSQNYKVRDFLLYMIGTGKMTPLQIQNFPKTKKKFSTETFEPNVNTF